MLSPELEKQMRQATLGKSRGRMIVCAGLILIGAAAFLISVTSAPERAWQAYHINFVFWTGLGFGVVLFSAVLNMADARWGRPMKRLAESFGAFLPVACILFGVAYLGREHIFPWVHHPPAKLAGWLKVDFLFVRDGAVMILLTLLGLSIVRSSLRLDSSGKQDAQEIVRSMKNQKILSTIYGIAYSFGLTLLAFDLIMSLEPHFYSTLFGGWYFMGSFYSGLAAVVLLMVFGVRSMGMTPYVRPQQFLSIGQLMLGFCLVTGDFFFTQVLIIWYANLPEETAYVLKRLRGDPWWPLSYVVLLCCYVIPFGIMLSRGIKMRIRPMILLSSLILVGFWLERMMLVAPALWKGDTFPLGYQEVLITAGFAGIVGLCVLLFLSRFPILPVRDPMLLEVIQKMEKGE